MSEERLIAPDGKTPPVEVETGADPSAAVIWLHGLGADGHDFEAIVPELALPAGSALRFVFPHAPFRPVTINNGYVMRAWYDFAITERGVWQDEAHIREAEQSVDALVRREISRGIAVGRIVLAGFSQGGNVVLHAGLHAAQPLAGIMVLSAPVVAAERLAGEVNAANRTTPVFLAHGSSDERVPARIGKQAAEVLARVGNRVEWHEYRMGHSVCPQEIADIAVWMRAVLALG